MKGWEKKLLVAFLRIVLCKTLKRSKFPKSTTEDGKLTEHKEVKPAKMYALLGMG